MHWLILLVKYLLALLASDAPRSTRNSTRVEVRPVLLGEGTVPSLEIHRPFWGRFGCWGHGWMRARPAYVKRAQLPPPGAAATRPRKNPAVWVPGD